MKYLNLLFIALLFAGITSCKNDEPDPPTINNLLFLDGENATAPILPGGESYETAVLFSENATDQYTGRQLLAVDFVVYTAFGGTVYIYEGGNSSPGSIIAQQSFTANDLTGNAWNRIEFDSPAAINGLNLWIGIRFTAAGNNQLVGCDAGPNRSGGDWLFESTDNQWQTYRQRSGESINWNIRGVVSEQ